jgi:hypothetical protein
LYDGFIGLETAPILASAKNAMTYSGRLVMNRQTRSPGPMPMPRSALPKEFTSPSSSRNVMLTSWKAMASRSG